MVSGKPVKDRYGNVVTAICKKCKQDWQKHEMRGGVCPPCLETFEQYKARVACRICNGNGKQIYRRRASGGALAEYTKPCVCVTRFKT